MRYGAAGGEVEISFSGYTNSSDGRTKRDGGRSRAWMKPSPGLTESAIESKRIVRLYIVVFWAERGIHLWRGELEPSYRVVTCGDIA